MDRKDRLYWLWEVTRFIQRKCDFDLSFGILVFGKKLQQNMQQLIDADQNDRAKERRKENASK